MTNDLTIDPSAVIGAADSALVTLERMPRSERAEMLRALARGGLDQAAIDQTAGEAALDAGGGGGRHVEAPLANEVAAALAEVIPALSAPPTFSLRILRRCR